LPTDKVMIKKREDVPIELDEPKVVSVPRDVGEMLVFLGDYEFVDSPPVRRISSQSLEILEREINNEVRKWDLSLTKH